MTRKPAVTHVLLQLGPLPVPSPVVTTWATMLVLVLASGLLTRRLTRLPGRGQVLLELLVTGIAGQIRATVPRNSERYLPLIGTLFLFIASLNLLSLVPGLEPPTAHIETPANLALVVFAAAHWYGVQTLGLWRYLARFAEAVGDVQAALDCHAGVLELDPYAMSATERLHALAPPATACARWVAGHLAHLQEIRAGSR
jgi:F-type H+-transporting ATPase subunit a